MSAYIGAVALAQGVNPVIAQFIVAHESQDGRNMIGHEANGTISYGYWQFNDANEDFNYDCAMDLECSTNLAMQWILAGKLDKWTTWAKRCLWFPKDNPPNC